MPVATRSARAAAAGSAAHAPAPITAATPQQTLSNSTNSGKKRKATVEPESSGPSVPAKKPKTNSKAKPVKREKEEVEKKTEKKSVAPEKVAAPKKKTPSVATAASARPSRASKRKLEVKEESVAPTQTPAKKQKTVAFAALPAKSRGQRLLLRFKNPSAALLEKFGACVVEEAIVAEADDPASAVRVIAAPDKNGEMVRVAPSPIKYGASKSHPHGVPVSGPVQAPSPVPAGPLGVSGHASSSGSLSNSLGVVGPSAPVASRVSDDNLYDATPPPSPRRRRAAAPPTSPKFTRGSNDGSSATRIHLPGTYTNPRSLSDPDASRLPPKAGSSQTAGPAAAQPPPAMPYFPSRFANEPPRDWSKVPAANPGQHVYDVVNKRFYNENFELLRKF